MVPQQASDPAELLPHTLFRNRYYIIGQVGVGGFGSVYKATDTQSGDRLVAIKEVKLLGLHPPTGCATRWKQASNEIMRRSS